jgi:mediator of RNA polymerase II transcription subunit 21
MQVSQDVPITKQRNPEKYDAPDVFEGLFCLSHFARVLSYRLANKKELVTDLVVKAKQVEYLIKSLPEPEPEEEQVRYVSAHF